MDIFRRFWPSKQVFVTCMLGGNCGGAGAGTTVCWPATLAPLPVQRGNTYAEYKSTLPQQQTRALGPQEHINQKIRRLRAEISAWRSRQRQ